MSDTIQTDVLILGSGIAGATTALALADTGVGVTVVTRATEPTDSNTTWAQGGIIYEGQEDSPDLLAADIERAGAGHCNPEAVHILATEGPEAVRTVLLDRVGTPFDHMADGVLSLAREGGHSLPRIIHAADATGRAISVALVREMASHPNIHLLTGHTAVDLLTPSHHARNRLAVYEPRACVGAYLLDQATGQVTPCLARATVLATGGLGQIYLRTTNPVGSRGDGVAMTYRAGGRVINMEFVQFHPTAFFSQGNARFLVSEAVRGAGARLVHADGQPFMQNHDPEWKDLAPRDVVARSIHKEMLARDVPNVFLNLHDYVSQEEIHHHFPTIHARALEYGVDIARQPAPVVPAAHYACGGVWVDMDGRTTIHQLYAVGEVACTGLHGANRLASTSLLEGLVWGRRAATDIRRSLPHLALHPAADIPSWQDQGQFDADPALISQDMTAIKHIMWNYVGLVRTTPRLARALRDLRQLEIEIERFYRTARLTDSLIGLRSAVRTAVLVATAAWENRHSVGCHYRE